MGDGNAAFDSIMASLDAAMAVVTTASEHERAGCLVGFHSQSGIEPNSLSVWLSKANHTFRVATFAQTFAVHFLTCDDFDIAERFGTVSGDETDKFASCAWHQGPDGVPLLDACPHRVIGRKVAALDTRADHVCLVLDPIDAQTAGAFDPLRLSAVAHLRPGHEAPERPEPPTTTAKS